MLLNFLFHSRKTTRISNVLVCPSKLIHSDGRRYASDNKGNDNVLFSHPIPESALDLTYSTSSGPGGQNVNKSSSKVQLRVNIPSATWLTEDMKTKFMEKASPNLLTKQGDLLIRSEKFRSPRHNYQDALQKLKVLLYDVIEKPESPKISDEEAENIRKGKIRASKKRLVDKRVRSQIKQDRRGNHDW